MNTVGGVNITSRVKLGLEGTSAPTSPEYSDADLDVILEQAIAEYSNEVPYIQKSTITTVVNQDSYALPSTAMHVVEVEYRKTLVNADEIDWDEDDYIPGIDTTGLEAMDYIRRKLRIATDKIGEGTWEEVDNLTSYGSGRYLVVYPAPEEVGTIRLRFSCVHPLVGTNYITIPSHHANVIARICIAIGKETKAAMMMHEPLDYDSGQTRMRQSSLRSSLVMEAKSEREIALQSIRNLQISIG
jgi:hypothetical protein